MANLGELPTILNSLPGSSLLTGNTQRANPIILCNKINESYTAKIDIQLYGQPLGTNALFTNRTGRISGIVKEAGAPVANKLVVLIHRNTNNIIAATFSDSNGEFVFEYIDKNSTYSILSKSQLIGSPQYNAVVSDYITPIDTGPIPAEAAPLLPDPTTDPYFSSVQLLVHADSVIPFEDVKGHTKTIGNTPDINTSVYKYAPCSMYFNQEYIRYPSSGATADFKLPAVWTIECWFYINTIAHNKYLFALGGSTFSIFDSGGNSYLNFAKTTSVRTPTTGNIIPSRWYHVAFVNDGTNLRGYLDGILLSSQVASGTDVANGYASVGGYSDSISAGFDGYIDEFRYTPNVCRYTRNFSLRTSRYPDLLQFSPDPFFNNVVCLMHYEGGADGSTVFTDVKGHTVVPVGSAQIDTAQSKFGQAYLGNGSGSKLYITTSSDFVFAGDFTFECWAKRVDTVGSFLTLMGSVNSNAYPDNEWEFIINGSKQLQFYISSSGNRNAVITGATLINDTNWHHFAASRTSTVIKIFLDGIQQGSDYSSSRTLIGSTRFYIGGCFTSASGEEWYGNIDEVRITKEISRYTSNFPVPLAPFPDE